MALGRTAFGKFMASTAGRVLRIVAGLGLVIWGYALLTAPLGWALIIVGLVPLAAGVFDFCVISALLGGPFWGAQIRAG